MLLKVLHRYFKLLHANTVYVSPFTKGYLVLNINQMLYIKIHKQFVKYEATFIFEI